MNLQLAGRKALVTGASTGIGAATARVLAGEGVDVVLVARNREALEHTRAQIEALPVPHGAACVEVYDLADGNSARALAAAHADVDILVNNAGAVPSGGLLQVDEAAWRAGWDTKVFAYVNLCREFYRTMKTRGRGVIVNLSGAGARMKRPDYICGGMGNAAIDFLTEALGASSPADNIRVIGISPGPVETERYQKIAAQRLAAGDKPRVYPFGRVAQPEEIGRLIAFCASDHCGYVSGTVLMVDGGISVARSA